jgi:hypothetical protein
MPRYGQPSTLEDPDGQPSTVDRRKKKKRKKRRRKRPGSAKRSKTAERIIHETIPLAIANLPKGMHTVISGSPPSLPARARVG